jgi:hypothetical protein
LSKGTDHGFFWRFLFPVGIHDDESPQFTLDRSELASTGVCMVNTSNLSSRLFLGNEFLAIQTKPVQIISVLIDPPAKDIIRDVGERLAL